MLTSKTGKSSRSKSLAQELVAVLQPTMEYLVRWEIEQRHRNDVTYRETVEQVRAEFISDAKMAQSASRWPDSTVENLTRLIIGSGDSSEVPSIVIRSLEQEDSAAVVNAMVMLEPDAYTYAEFSDEEYTYDQLRPLVSGLTKYSHLGFDLPEDVFRASDEDLSTFHALVSLTSVLVSLDISGVEHDPTTGNARIVDEEVIKLVIDQPSEIDRILGIMEERHLFNAEAIRNIIEADSMSLSNGIL